MYLNLCLISSLVCYLIPNSIVGNTILEKATFTSEKDKFTLFLPQYKWLLYLYKQRIPHHRRYKICHQELRSSRDRTGGQDSGAIR